MASSTYKVGQRVAVSWAGGCTGLIVHRDDSGLLWVKMDKPQLLGRSGAVTSPRYPGCICFSAYWVKRVCDGLLDV